MSSNELVPATPTTVQHVGTTGELSLQEQWRFAEAVASSNIVPRAYRGDPGGVLVAVNLGQPMGLSPAESLYRIHVIEGKPSASAELIASNVRRAGHRLRIRSTNEAATAQIVRADDADFPFEVTWTIEDARRAKLTGKDNWVKYPASMLRARAISECARQACPEALYGVTYVEGEVVESVTHDVTPARESAADVLAPQQPDAEPESETSDGITSGQLKKIGALMRDADITDRAVALTYVGDVIDRQISSRNDLTKDEASRVIDALNVEAVADRNTGEIPGRETTGAAEDNFGGVARDE